MRRPLTDAELQRQLHDLPDWELDGQVLRGRFEFPSFTDLIRAVTEIAVVAEELDHHPDLDVRWRTLVVALTTHSAAALTQLDIESAHRIGSCVHAEGGRSL